MPKKCQCPKCGRDYDLPFAMQGKRVKCAQCKTVFEAPVAHATDQGEQIDLDAILDDHFNSKPAVSEAIASPTVKHDGTAPDRSILHRLCTGMIIAGCLFVLAYPVWQYRVLSVAGEAIEKIFEAGEKLQTAMGQLPGANPPTRDNLEHQVTMRRMRSEASQAFFIAMTISILAAVVSGGSMIAAGLAGKLLIDLEKSVHLLRDSQVKA